MIIDIHDKLKLIFGQIATITEDEEPEISKIRKPDARLTSSKLWVQYIKDVKTLFNIISKAKHTGLSSKLYDFMVKEIGKENADKLKNKEYVSSNRLLELINKLLASELYQEIDKTHKELTKAGGEIKKGSPEFNDAVAILTQEFEDSGQFAEPTIDKLLNPYGLNLHKPVIITIPDHDGKKRIIIDPNDDIMVRLGKLVEAINSVPGKDDLIKKLTKGIKSREILLKNYNKDISDSDALYTATAYSIISTAQELVNDLIDVGAFKGFGA